MNYSLAVSGGWKEERSDMAGSRRRIHYTQSPWKLQIVLKHYVIYSHWRYLELWRTGRNLKNAGRIMPSEGSSDKRQ